MKVAAGRVLAHVPCNLCGREVTRGVHNISRLVECLNCGLIFVNPRPDFSELSHLYEDSYFHCAQPTFGGYEDYEGDHDDILRTFRRRIARITPLLATNRPQHLDVGCATGIFLEAATQSGWQTLGIDISSYALERARAKGFHVERGSLPGLALPEGSFDVITMWDLFEHVPDPASLLTACHRLLKPGGVLAISTPDAGSFAARLLRGKWLGFRCIDEHLYFFSRLTITQMLTAANFAVRDIHAVGKYLSLPRMIARLRFYTRIGALLLQSMDRLVPNVSMHVSSGDTMCVLAVRS
ncbi:MAG: class I SAM-dependent methyltransferase [Deltaproteobacteria bacterium]|nr:class I SAM-dependent methyltransferase [Deltaproteobacteria bacterium]